MISYYRIVKKEAVISFKMDTNIAAASDKFTHFPTSRLYAEVTFYFELKSFF